MDGGSDSGSRGGVDGRGGGGLAAEGGDLSSEEADSAIKREEFGVKGAASRVGEAGLGLNRDVEEEIEEKGEGRGGFKSEDATALKGEGK